MTVKNSANDSMPTVGVVTSLSTTFPSVGLCSDTRSTHTVDYNNNDNSNNGINKIGSRRLASNLNSTNKKLTRSEIIKRWSSYFPSSETFLEDNVNISILNTNLKDQQDKIFSPSIDASNLQNQSPSNTHLSKYIHLKNRKSKALSWTDLIDYSEENDGVDCNKKTSFFYNEVYQKEGSSSNLLKNTNYVESAETNSMRTMESYESFKLRSNRDHFLNSSHQQVVTKRTFSNEDDKATLATRMECSAQNTAPNEATLLSSISNMMDPSDSCYPQVKIVNQPDKKVPNFENHKLLESLTKNKTQESSNHEENEKQNCQRKTRRIGRSMSTCLPPKYKMLQPFCNDAESQNIHTIGGSGKISRTNRTYSLDNSAQSNNALFDVKERIQKPRQFLSVKACEINIESHKNLRTDDKVYTDVESQITGTDKSGKGNSTIMEKKCNGSIQSNSPGSYYNHDKNFKPQTSKRLSYSMDSNNRVLGTNSIEQINYIQSKDPAIHRKISLDINRTNSFQESKRSVNTENNSAEQNFLNQSEFEPKQFDEICDRRSKTRSISSINTYTEPFVPRSAYLRKRLEEISQICKSEDKLLLNCGIISKETDKCGEVEERDINKSNKIENFEHFNNRIDNYYNDKNISEDLSKSFSSSSSNLFSQYLFKNSDRSSQELGVLGKSSQPNTNDSEYEMELEFESTERRPSKYSGTEAYPNYKESCIMESEFGTTEPLRLSIDKIKYKKQNNFRELSLLNSSSTKGNESNDIVQGIDNISFTDTNNLENTTHISKSPISVFGPITRISSTKISRADELKSFSDRNRKNENKNAFSEDSVTIKGVNLKSDIDAVHDEDYKYSFINQSEKHDHKESNSPEHEKQKKHSLSSLFSFRKDKDSTHNTVSNFSASFDNDLGNSNTFEGSVTSPPIKHRRASSLFRLFHKKSIDQTDSQIENIETSKLDHDKDNILNNTFNTSVKPSSKSKEENNLLQNDINHGDQSKKNIKQKVSKSLSITVNSKRKLSRSQSQEKKEEKKKESFVDEKSDFPSVADTFTNNSSLVSVKQNINNEVADEVSEVPNALKNTLSVPEYNQEFGSQESVYDSETGIKKYSKNKERIKNRKAAKKEAMDRTKSLPIDAGDLQIDFTNALQVGKAIESVEKLDNSNIEASPATPGSTRKKHKARRANTEFITNVPEICLQPSTPQMVRDDGVVLRRNNKRNNRLNRPKTLLSGIDSDMIFLEGGKDKGSGVVNENLSFAEIKKKLLEGLPDNINTNVTPEKVPQNERQKIKRTKSTKRYKTITEGIAPRDLELAKQAAAAAQQGENKRESLNKETFEQITAALMSNTDKRKSFLVEDHPSNFKSNEDLRASYTNLSNPNMDGLNKPTMLKRTKSMTTININLDVDEDTKEQIKPLSEMKNRFLQAMEHTKQKHLTKKTPIDLSPRVNSRKERPHTISGLDDWTMDKLQNEIKNETEKEKFEKTVLEKNNQKQTESNKNILNKSANNVGEEPAQKREKKRYTRLDSKKLFEDLFDDLESIMNEGLTETDLASALECNPSLHYSQKDLSENILNDDNDPEKVDKCSIENQLSAKRQQNGTNENLSDLDFVSNLSTKLTSVSTSDKRSLRPQRHHKSGVNPIKLLQQRDDLIDETSLVATAKNEKTSTQELKVTQTIEMKRNSGCFSNKQDLDDNAISALRMTVDFSKTKLRKVEVGEKSNGLSEGFEVSTVTNILLQIKGRKKVQTSVVNYHISSLNCNDCFLIITPKDLFCWYGAQANVIEKAKAAEIASRINQKKEMGCKAIDVIYVDQGGQTENKIMRLLSEENTEELHINNNVLDDEDFEKTITSAYMTYTLCEANDPPELVPVDTQCHRMPSKEILLTNCVFVFDFITEVYVWVGQQTNSQQRKAIQQLATEKFKEGYYALDLNTTNSALSSIPHLGKTRRISISFNHNRNKHPKRASTKQGRHQKGEVVKRPDYALLMLFFEGSEWVIFKEKFCDWPDESRIIRMKGGPEGEVIKPAMELSINPVDPTTMIAESSLPKLILEGYDMGRGCGNPNGMDGYHVITLDVKTWFVSENNSILLPDESFGQFHSGEGYVIRWHYRIVKVRALRNLDDPLKAGGVERCCYFFWLGNDCSVNEEGATALMTVELDKEKGPQIRVTLGKEPPALLNLFNGGMVIHAGKRPAPGLRSEYTDSSVIRLYCIRGEQPNEACLLQVPAISESLRSRSSFVLLLCAQGEVFLWHGCCSNEETRATANHAAKQLIANHPDEASIASMNEIGFTEVEEGEEPEVFWLALGGHEDYGSLLYEDKSNVSKMSPRLFQMQSTTGTFIAHEIICPSRKESIHCPFPVLQDDMYNVEQPAIFILDSSVHIYVWFGWWPDDDDVGESSSKIRRWGEERKKAMESALLYAEEMDRDPDKLYIVYAGLEPESFIDLFPYWVIQEDITDLQIDMGIEQDKLYKVTEELALFTKDYYTIEELRRKPPPQGVDPTKLEKYLSEESFLEVFHFQKATFYKLPVWQQVNWKKKVGLY